MLYQLLDDSAEKFNDKVAIDDGSNEITYGDLLKRSNNIAQHLLAMNIGDERVVGVYLNKSINAISAFFGVLKTDSAYIPMDTYYSPDARIENIIRLSKMKYIITDDRNVAKISSILANGINEVEIINIDRITTDNHICDNSSVSDSSNSSSSNNSINRINIINEVNIDESNSSVTIPCLSDEKATAERIDNDKLAYILYTSGSTGNPKGVMISHLNAMAFIDWAINYFRPESKDIFCNFAPFTFDLSVFDIFASIACGAKICILPYEMANNPRAIVNWLNAKAVTYMYTVPSVWENLINYSHIKKTGLKNVKKVLFAGEVFPVKYLKIAMDLLEDADFYNLYGPTETNVCTFYHVKNVQAVGEKPVPIGSPCGEMKIMAINSENKQVEIDDIGELYVCGPTVSKGYFNDIETTRHSYVKNPLHIDDNSIFYKTGDLVRYCGNSVYEYVSRKDSMVKYRGFRIELNEIENTLLNNSKVNEAAVVAIKVNDDKILIGAVVEMKKKNIFSVTEFKEYIGKFLPRYMIPDVIVEMDNIPKNMNGKIDRLKICECLKIEMD